MTRDDLRERVAKAIYAAATSHVSAPAWDALGKASREQHLIEADAAIRVVVEVAAAKLNAAFDRMDLRASDPGQCDELVRVILALAPERKTNEGGDDA